MTALTTVMRLVGRNTERQRQRRDEGEAAVTRKQRQGESNVLQHAHTLTDRRVKVP